MDVSTLSAAGNANGTNEDWVSASAGLIVVLDGATVRTETGCQHGVGWYVAKLGSALTSFGVDHRVSLKAALAAAIGQVAALHSECDLRHPGTPSAAVGAIRATQDNVEYLALGDVTIVLDSDAETQVITDDRVDLTALPERRSADRHLIGSAEKQTALLSMKHAELAARNQPGGYWVASSDPAVVTHALIGSVKLPSLRRMAMLSDGAARMVSLFNAWTWPALLDVLDTEGLEEVVRQTRLLEDEDPVGRKWPRNKRSDDATLVYARLAESRTT